jgi:iron-sulfur cluster assembly accessory protein
MAIEVVKLTEAALKYLTEQCVENDKNIKLEVKGGGCAGYSYDYGFCGPSTDAFDSAVPLRHGYSLIVDGISVMYVLGTTLDYVNKLGQSGLVFHNPNEVSSCGCGKSFSV